LYVRNSPRVCIVMPAFNASAVISDAVHSVRDQTFTDWDLIIVEDSSRDDTPDVIARLAASDRRIRILSNQTNLGAAASRNRALEAADGSHVAFLDSDDLWHPRKLEKQLDFMAQTHSAITFGDYLRIDWKGAVLNRVCAPRSTDYKAMLLSNFIGNLTAIYDRQRLGALRFQCVGNEDHLFWLDALKQLDEPVFATPSDVPLASYRVNKDSLSGNKLRSAMWQWQLHRRLLGHGRLKSSYYMAAYVFHGVRKRLPCAV